MKCEPPGDLPFRTFDAGSVEEIKAESQNRPRKANQIIALFRILLGYAVKLRLIHVNPALRPPSPMGKPWAHRNFARSWDAVRRKAGIEGWRALLDSNQ